MSGGVERGRFVRDIYTYSHIPIVAGIVLIAVALEYVTLHPTDPIPASFRAMGAAGFVLFYGGVSIGVYRSFRVLAVERIATIVAIVTLSLLGGSVDGLVLFIVIDVVIFIALAVEHVRIERPGSATADLPQSVVGPST